MPSSSATVKLLENHTGLHLRSFPDWPQQVKNVPIRKDSRSNPPLSVNFTSETVGSSGISSKVIKRCPLPEERVCVSSEL
ncbi:MAG: hypothetical protein ABGX43_06700 [Nitrospinaceae bacterium]